ncbi:MAG: hypothetical protein M1347_04385 [Chloroflexi bacterium]|nr:hypothetical protein [Chloroflexota bacterium]
MQTKNSWIPSKKRRLWLAQTLIAFTAFLRSNLEVLLATSIGIAWSYYFVTMGLGFTPDSATYLSSALKLAYAGQLSQSPLWPPLYPVLLAIVTIFTRFPADAAAITSSVSLLSFLLLFACFLKRVNKQVLFNLLLLLLLATLKGFYSIFETAWSEQLFSLIFIGNFYFLLKFLETHSRHYFLLGTGLASLAMITRYIGISLGLSALFISIFWISSETPLEERLKRFIGPALLSFTPLAVWLLRNYSVYGSLFGANRIHQEFSFAEPLSSIFGVFLQDLGSPFFVVLIGLLLLHVWNRIKGRTKTQAGTFSLAALIVTTYLTFLIISASVSTVDIGSRFLAPVYFLPLAFLAAQFDDLLSPINSHGMPSLVRKTLAAAIIILTAFMLIEQIKVLDNVDRRLEAPELAAEQTRGGFNLSTTSQGLNIYFHKVLQEQDQLALFVFLEDKNFYASSFLFKGSLIKRQEYSNFRFSHVRDQGYQIEFSAPHAKKIIIYFDTTLLSKSELFPPIISSKVVETGNSKFYVLVSESWLQANAVDPQTITPPSNQRLLSRSHIEPYWIFEAEVY